MFFKNTDLMLKLILILSAMEYIPICHPAEPMNCDNMTLTSYTYDDTLIRNIAHQMELLNVENQNLRLRLEVLNSRLEHHTILLTDLSRKLNERTTCEPALAVGSSNETRYLSEYKCELHNFKRIYQNRYFSNQAFEYPSNCAEATALTRKTGIYTIKVHFFQRQPFLVACNDDAYGGGWTIIQRRLDGSVDFFRDWHDYKIGFGNLDGEFFIGLDRIHALTTAMPQELIIIMDDFEGTKKYAKYESFAIGDESEAYYLKMLGKFSGEAGDSLTQHLGQKFSTKDRDNDIHSGSCANDYTGAWWYAKCHSSNLNGQYLRGEYQQNQFGKGIVWHSFRGYTYALKSIQMMIRPQRK